MKKESKDLKNFRNSSSFGKRIEFYVIGRMLLEGLDLYIPLVDDNAIDLVVKKPNGSFVEIQIKARSKDIKFGEAALFAALNHEYRKNYWFVFYSERMDKFWILSSKEFIKNSSLNKKGKNVGKRSIKFNGKKTKDRSEHVLPKFKKYVVTNFKRILMENPDNNLS